MLIHLFHHYFVVVSNYQEVGNYRGLITDQTSLYSKLPVSN